MAAPKLTANRILLIVLLFAGGLAAVLIAVSVMGGKNEATPTTVNGAAATEQLLAGIPQKGNVLGQPNAPVTMVEYADYQCPYCARWAVDTFPAIVREYVRSGKVKIVFNGVAIIGPDSVTALRTAVSAGAQNRLWNMTELLYHNQGQEESGWVTDDLLRSLGENVSGLDVKKMMAGRDSAEVTTALADAQGSAQAAGISSTPTFEIGRTGGSTQQLQGALPTQQFRQVLNSLLGQ